MTTPGFKHMASVSASVERTGGIVGGKSNGVVVAIASLQCTPLVPISGANAIELMQTYQLATLLQLFESYVAGSPDIRNGDNLVIQSKRYPIRVVIPWPWHHPPEIRLRLILEDYKR